MGVRLEAESLGVTLLKTAEEIRARSEEIARQISDIYDQWEGTLPDEVRPLVEKLQKEKGLRRRISHGIDMFISEANNPINSPPNS